MKINREKIALDAMQLRKKYDIQCNGIPDIFSFVNQQEIELIRYPFGKNTVTGLSTLYEGKKIIVSNSSEILSREIYTVAHELGHIIYDFDGCGPKLRIDKEGYSDGENVCEQRAFYFADCLLMPEDKLRDSIVQNYKKQVQELRAINIVQMQLEFKVSYSALISRLYDLDFITADKKKALYSERDFYTSKKLFGFLGVEEELLKPAEKIIVPPQYIDFVMSNYENQYIPLSSLKNAFKLIDLDVSGLDERKKSDEDTFEDIFGEYE